MKGILFKDWKIKAIAEDDREWQTRRLDHLKEINKEPDKWILYDYQSAHGVVTHTNKPNSKGQFIFWQAPIFDSPDGSYKYIKPRYQVGEVVYIKEAWRIVDSQVTFGISQLRVQYKLDNYAHWFKVDSVTFSKYVNIDNYFVKKWQSPLFMPEWAARYFIKITDIRAERLQEITPEDCRKEGITKIQCDCGECIDSTEVGTFQDLWNSINPNVKWDTNPWVWRICFVKVSKP